METQEHISRTELCSDIVILTDSSLKSLSNESVVSVNRKPQECQNLRSQTKQKPQVEKHSKNGTIPFFIQPKG